jgi:hypothetical protein
VSNLPVPIPRTFVVDEVETAAYLNSLSQALEYLLNPPIATVYQTVSQSLSSGTPAPVSYDSSVVDTYGGHSDTVSPSRYTAQVAGWYTVGGATPFAGSGGGTYRKEQLYYNGNPVSYSAAQCPPVNSTSTATTIAISPANIYLNVGDYVSLYAECDTSSVSTTPNPTNEAYMTVTWAHS